MKKRWSVDIVFPVYFENIDILEDSTIEVLNHVKKIQDSYLFKIIISVNGPKSDKIIEKAKSLGVKRIKGELSNDWIYNIKTVSLELRFELLFLYQIIICNLIYKRCGC